MVQHLAHTVEQLTTIVTSRDSDQLWYVYGIVPADLAVGVLPAGLEDADVSLERADALDVGALVSKLPRNAYEPATLESETANVEWLSPRAVAHDRVLTAASDRGPVIPLPMFSLFSGRDTVHTMLRDRADSLRSTLRRLGDGREYALRVYRVDQELLAAVVSLSPRLGELAASAASASPGQRYLLERKLESEKKTEMRVVTQRVVDEIVDALAPHARAVARSPIPRVSDAENTRGTMVLNAAFLVASDALHDFQARLTQLVDERGAQGFRFDFTGPWPNYHFVSDAAHE